jgi:Flp pilus assembly protein TadG
MALDRQSAARRRNAVHPTFVRVPRPTETKSSIAVETCRLRANQEGAEMLEFALVITLLMTLLLGIVAFGRAWDVYQTITRAAREGARMAVLTGCAACSDSTKTYGASYIQSQVVNPALTAANLNPSLVQNYTQIIRCLDPSDTPPQEWGIQISYSYPYQLDVPFTTVNLTTLNLSTKVQMRLENQPTSTTGLTCP